MPKWHFLGGWFSTKYPKKCRFGISYENIDNWQEWKNCKIAVSALLTISFTKIYWHCVNIKKITIKVLCRYFFLVQLIFVLLNKKFYIFSTQNLMYYTIYVIKSLFHEWKHGSKFQNFKKDITYGMCWIHKVTKKSAINNIMSNKALYVKYAMRFLKYWRLSKQIYFH